MRRCLGASFAQFEMKVVLRELVSRLDLRAARPDQEARVRRAIVFAPARGGEVVAAPRSTGLDAANRYRCPEVRRARGGRRGAR